MRGVGRHRALLPSPVGTRSRRGLDPAALIAVSVCSTRERDGRRQRATGVALRLVARRTAYLAQAELSEQLGRVVHLPQPLHHDGWMHPHRRG